MRISAAGSSVAPTLPHCVWSLPPKGALTGCAEPRLGSSPAAGLMSPTHPHCLRSLPPKGALTSRAEPRLGSGPAAGFASPTRSGKPWGFTLIELLVVISLMAVAAAGISLAMRDSGEQQLQHEALRLATLLESARAQARTNGGLVVWRPMPQGFRFEGLPPGVSMPTQWLQAGVQVQPATPLVLGPEPLLPPQAVTLLLPPSAPVRVGSDGLRPFSIQTP